MGAARLSRQAPVVELWVLGLIQVAFSSFVTGGILMVDMTVHKIDWGLLENWVWLGAIALLGVIGLGLIEQSCQIVPD